MKTITLNTWNGDWTALAQELEGGNEPIALEINGTLHGVLVPAHAATPLITRYADRGTTRTAQTNVVRDDDATRGGDLLTYLELLRADPSLVPHVDGQPLAFVTMMNSSYVNPEQLYEFRHPHTKNVIIYRANELRQAIGRQFTQVEFVPPRPRDVVEGKLKLR
jgi:hypothetical protein